ncbi:three-Cys-motif partner protein TcmP [Ktedonosporobacter rubrisoli]|uniref:three-Cys-motif partner protein TcmP n=1 Tax=Ktedonosporobacter rubrisoli TaxID=2509675 RepID=UPI0013EE5514|nr:three-Cys-motif partner protein TcmP [Ktedonosporobacter rubrisoli]
MSTPQSVTWPLDPHTVAKHEILGRYLQAWLPIMTKSNERVILIDGFAGPGEYEGGEIGSPLIMLDAFLNHSYAQIRQKEVLFLFIEENPKRCAHLHRLIEDRKRMQLFPPRAAYQVYQGTFKDVVNDILTSLKDRRLTLAPTFAFIDPFGYSYTPFSIIQELLSYPQCEVLITFMYEEINRFLKAGYSTKEQQYTELFGTSAWKDIVTETMSSAQRKQLIHDLYRNQLLNLAQAHYVRSFGMRNKRNATDYFLFFATKHLRGMQRMKEAMCKVDPTGAYEFSDCTNPNQPYLFSLPNYAELERLLACQFKGRSVTIQEIEHFVIADTPFCKYKEALKRMELASPAKIIVAATAKRKRGTFADPKLRITFL